MINTKKQFKNLIKSINIPIYIAGHLEPDHDSICSCLALARLLEKIGKTVYVLLEDYDSDILTIHENKNLVVNDIKVDNYCFIALDLNETYRLGRYKKDFETANITINIDHHQGNNTNATLVITESDKSSTCEIIYNLIMSYGSIYIDKGIAECLYTGIMTDTNCFSRRISANTLTIAQKLINIGVNYENIIKKIFSHRTLYEVKALAKLINEIKHNEYFHYLIIDKSLDAFSQLTQNQITKNIAEDLRKIEDIDIFLILIVENNTITAKCMSNISKNANQIANLFGGGGHKGEAGFTIRNINIDEIINKTIEFLKKNK